MTKKNEGPVFFLFEITDKFLPLFLRAFLLGAVLQLLSADSVKRKFLQNVQTTGQIILLVSRQSSLAQNSLQTRDLLLHVSAVGLDLAQCLDIVV